MFTVKVDDDLKLKLLQEYDAAELFAVTKSSAVSLREWLPFIDSNESIADTQQFIRVSLKQFSNNDGFQAAIVFKEKIVGVIGFHQINWQNKSTSLGYWLSKDYEGLGIMTKSVRALINHAFLDLQLNRIEIRAAVENKRSRAIPERLGFTVEGISRQSEWLYDHYVDHTVYSILSEEWHK
ncbi:GNAT family N-acetyltransferase [Viridibacillus sp. YIM B01967]|uniref:GNAT family N-acetyltransferase n=1 Tax=Viridibacillus soli TaxID=2798301 RepID=A0ABS1H2P0_9BACL|nr:GNAT family protein [Viridibacillus soli]MBK3493661.1 GNAT family N-acetyltransferase [Viridibacillus soli]